MRRRRRRRRAARGSRCGNTGVQAAPFADRARAAADRARRARATRARRRRRTARAPAARRRRRAGTTTGRSKGAAARDDADEDTDRVVMTELMPRSAIEVTCVVLCDDGGGEGGERQRGDVGARGRGRAAARHGGGGDVRIPRWGGFDRSQSRGERGRGPELLMCSTGPGAASRANAASDDEDDDDEGRGRLGQGDHRRGARSRENDDGDVRRDARSRARGFGGDIGAHARGDARAHAARSPRRARWRSFDDARRRVSTRTIASSSMHITPSVRSALASLAIVPDRRRVPRPVPNARRPARRVDRTPALARDARIQRALPRRRLRLVRRAVEQRARVDASARARRTTSRDRVCWASCAWT